jgi:2,3-bisphosphoglycerate-dependent phosphoglycerate mutase
MHPHMTLAVRFIRHGESVANAGGVTAEPRGIPLTALGREQALAIARGFAQHDPQKHAPTQAGMGPVLRQGSCSSKAMEPRSDAIRTDQAPPPDLIITSPYTRARDSAAPTAARFPDVPLEVWPVQEFASLAFARCENTTAVQRRPWVEDHWALADPDRVDGPGAECYAGLVGRVRAALLRLSGLSVRSVVVFSHGQFMKAVHWEIANASPPVTPETMLAFRAFHTAAPIANAEGFTAYWDGAVWRID